MLENEQRTTARRVITEEESEGEGEREREKKCESSKGTGRPIDRLSACFFPTTTTSTYWTIFSSSPLSLPPSLPLCVSVSMSKCYINLKFLSLSLSVSNLDENFQIITLLRSARKSSTHSSLCIYIYMCISPGYSSTRGEMTVFNSYLFW